MAIPREDPLRKAEPGRHQMPRTIRSFELDEGLVTDVASHTLAGAPHTGSLPVYLLEGTPPFQEGSGAPTHQAARSTPYVDLATNTAYVNTDGGTTWAAIGGGGGATFQMAQSWALS